MIRFPYFNIDDSISVLYVAINIKSIFFDGICCTYNLFDNNFKDQKNQAN